MKSLQVKSLVFLGIVALAAPLFMVGEARADDPPGSRYALERFYHSEISSARAYLDTENGAGILIDVRSVREYTAGHPAKSYNIPYPRIESGITQDPQVFFDAVAALVKSLGGDTSTPIFTLCRTGYRSVLAGNILAYPKKYGVHNPNPLNKGFHNVRNIWEGFVGRYMEVNHGSGAEHVTLDLNNDGIINSDTSDVYDHTPDANPDKDGWRNYQQLPWTSDLNGPQLYLPYLHLYEFYSGESIGD